MLGGSLKPSPVIVSGRSIHVIGLSRAVGEETFHLIYQLLTDEQKEEMDTMMEQRESRRDHWREGGKKSRE